MMEFCDVYAFLMIWACIIYREVDRGYVSDSGVCDMKHIIFRGPRCS